MIYITNVMDRWSDDTNVVPSIHQNLYLYHVNCMFIRLSAAPRIERWMEPPACGSSRELRNKLLPLTTVQSQRIIYLYKCFGWFRVPSRVQIVHFKTMLWRSKTILSTAHESLGAQTHCSSLLQSHYALKINVMPRLPATVTQPVLSLGLKALRTVGQQQ